MVMKKIGDKIRIMMNKKKMKGFKDDIELPQTKKVIAELNSKDFQIVENMRK